MTTIEQPTTLGANPAANTPLIGPVTGPVSKWRRWTRGTAGRVYLNRPKRNARVHWLRFHAKLRDRSQASLLVLEYLAEHADPDGFVWASQEEMAQACSVSIRHVRRVLGWLADDGMVTKYARQGVRGPSGYFTDRYRVLMRECECASGYDMNGRERPEFARVESVTQVAQLSTDRTWGPVNRSYPPVKLNSHLLKGCRGSASGLHRPGPDGFCYSCGYRP
jgi:hypothetical protein